MNWQYSSRMRKSWPVMPSIPEYAPWHEYVAGRAIVRAGSTAERQESLASPPSTLPLSRGRVPLRDADPEYLESLEIVLEGTADCDRIIAMGASPLLHDFQVERIMCPEPFGIWRVAVDGYLVRGELRDPKVDLAHADLLDGRPFRAFDLVPFACRRGAWIVVAFTQPIGFDLEHVAIFGQAVAAVTIGGVAAPSPKEASK